MPRKSKEQIKEEEIAIERKRKITWIIICLVTISLIFFALTKMGKLGLLLNNLLTYLVGTLYIIPLLTLFGYAIYYVFFSSKYEKSIKVIIGLYVGNLLVLILCSFIGDSVATGEELLSFITDKITLLTSQDAFETINGGIIGNSVYVLFNMLVDRSGVVVVMLVLFIITLILVIPVDTYKNMYADAKQKAKDAKEARQEREQRKEEERIAREKEEEEKRLQLAQEMMEQQEELEAQEVKSNYADEEIVEDPVIEEEVIEDEEEEEEKVDTYSTNSPFLINLTDNELGTKKKRKTSSTKNKNTNSNSYEENDVSSKESDEHRQQKILKVKRNNGTYKTPKPLEQFLEPMTGSSSNVNKTSAALKGEKVIEILKNFDIDASLVHTYIGPSVTKFEIKPNGTVKINRINNISDNIKMELAARDIRIEAPIPGRSAVGIEIPNVEPIPVKMIDLLKAVPADKKNNPLIFALGKDLMGEAVFCDISKMPHLLIAGATGSGKSVCINSIITSLLMRTNPDEVKIVLIDPKKVEFAPYKDIPHLLWPVIDDSTLASNMLKRIVVMMEERYEAFKDVGAKNIEGFNNIVDENNLFAKADGQQLTKMPYIVVIIDELADLMSVASKEVELSIQRITQLARASGIHLVVATQRPSTDVITGLIKSNIPSRISFAVASSIDSRTILDATGAERLLGNGDMLYHPQGSSAPTRLQGVFVTDREIAKITSYVKSQASPSYEDSYFEFLNAMHGTTVMGAGAVNADEMDSLYDQVVEFVKVKQKASTSLLQRGFGIGYNRAARLIDTLEDKGIIGPSNGSKPREVYIKPDED